MAQADVIRTPDQRLRVFVSSTLEELAPERQAVRSAVTRLRLVPVMFDAGARPHPPRQVYRDYLAQSQIFVGIYWQRYGWVAPNEQVSGLEDEYLRSEGLPRLIYVKSPAPRREPRLMDLLMHLRDDAGLSYQTFTTAEDLQRLVENDLAVLLSERFQTASPGGAVTERPLAGAFPVPAMPVVGRGREAARLRNLVLRHGARLVTLTGPGGVGKTRLAIEAARKLEASFTDGARLIRLSSVSAAGLVADAIAAGLGVTTACGSLTTDLKSYLQSRRLLLVLDNFEQVIGAAAYLADLLSAAPGVVALVTSRTVLRLSGEHELPVAPLPVPEAGSDRGRTVSQLRKYASVRLFVEQAHAVDPDFELTTENADAIAEICRRLDGLPLAIELAAGWARMLPLQALLTRLDDRMRLLTGGARDLPERQQTLRRTLDWSYELLTPAEKALFARLGAFVGTFSLPAIEAISGAGDPSAEQAANWDGPGDVVNTLGALVDCSLVRAENRGSEPRFGLLDTIRQYAAERLLENDRVWLDTRYRHAAYYSSLARPTANEWHGTGELSWLERLDTDHENLAAAVLWLVDSDQVEPAVDVLCTTWRFWWFYGHAEELAHFGDQILAKRDRLPVELLCLSLTLAGLGRLSVADLVGAQALLEESLPLLRQTGRGVLGALVSAVLGHLSASDGRSAAATGLLEHSDDELRRVENDRLGDTDRFQYLLGIALVPNFLGQISLGQGDPDTAARLFTTGLQAALRARDRSCTLISRYDLALSRQATGDLASAREQLSAGVSLAARTRDETSLAYFLEGLAALAVVEDEPQDAVGLLAAASGLLENLGSGWLHAWVPRAPHGQEAVAPLRARLGDTPFQEAWLRGRAVTASSAEDYALRRRAPSRAVL